MCSKVVSKDPFMLKYCLDRQKIQEMCDKAVDAFLPALKLVPDWFVTRKIIKTHDDALFANHEIDFFDGDSASVTFLVMKWVILV